jgi:hypothetical protein
MKSFVYDQVEVGESIGPIEYEFTEEEVEEHHKSINATHPGFVEEDSKLVEPSILSNAEYEAFHEEYPGPSVGIHVDHTLEFHSTIHIGDKIKVKGEVTDKYIKRDRKYVESEIEFIGEDNELVGRATRSAIREVPE